MTTPISREAFLTLFNKLAHQTDWFINDNGSLRSEGDHCPLTYVAKRYMHTAPDATGIDDNTDWYEAATLLMVEPETAQDIMDAADHAWQPDQEGEPWAAALIALRAQLLRAALIRE